MHDLTRLAQFGQRPPAVCRYRPTFEIGPAGRIHRGRRHAAKVVVLRLLESLALELEGGFAVEDDGAQFIRQEKPRLFTSLPSDRCGRGFSGFTSATDREPPLTAIRAIGVSAAEQQHSPLMHRQDASSAANGGGHRAMIASPPLKRSGIIDCPTWQGCRRSRWSKDRLRVLAQVSPVVLSRHPRFVGRSLIASPTTSLGRSRPGRPSGSTAFPGCRPAQCNTMSNRRVSTATRSLPSAVAPIGA